MIDAKANKIFIFQVHFSKFICRIFLLNFPKFFFKNSKQIYFQNLRNIFSEFFEVTFSKIICGNLSSELFEYLLPNFLEIIFRFSRESEVRETESLKIKFFHIILKAFLIFIQNVTFSFPRKTQSSQLKHTPTYTKSCYTSLY